MQHTARAKAEKQLYYEELMREYFEWRDSTSKGHTADKENFSRMDEIIRWNESKHAVADY